MSSEPPTPSSASASASASGSSFSNSLTKALKANYASPQLLKAAPSAVNPDMPKCKNSLKDLVVNTMTAFPNLIPFFLQILLVFAPWIQKVSNVTIAHNNTGSNNLIHYIIQLDPNQCEIS